jgi:hypothetical protein
MPGRLPRGGAAIVATSAVSSGPCLPDTLQSLRLRGGWRYGRASSTARANDGRASRRARGRAAGAGWRNRLRPVRIEQRGRPRSRPA